MKNLFLILMLGLFSQAHATTIDVNSTDPNFSYGGLDWTADISYLTGGTEPTTPLDGFIEYDVTPGTVSLTSSNNGSGVYAITSMSTTASVNAVVDFSWFFETLDDANFEFLLWINAGAGEATRTLTNFVDLTQSGVESFIVSAGDIFGFSIETFDNLFGPSMVDISEFSFTALAASPVPLPPALLLFGIGIAGLGMVRRKSPVPKVK